MGIVMNNDPATADVDINKLQRKQTENYITLKPIAERFNRVAKEISDDDIRQIIKSEIREQMKNINFTYGLRDIVDNFLDNNENLILNMYKKSLEEKFK